MTEVALARGYAFHAPGGRKSPGEPERLRVRFG